MKTTSEIIKNIRFRFKLSQKDLAEILSISQSNVSSMESGRQNISLPKLKEYCKKLKIDFEIILKF